MLILSRKVNESIVIDGRIVVKVVRVDGEVVKVGVEAPSNVPVHRQEVYEEILQSNRGAIRDGRSAVPRLPETKAKHQSGQNTTVKINTTLKIGKQNNKQNKVVSYDNKH